MKTEKPAKSFGRGLAGFFYRLVAVLFAIVLIWLTAVAGTSTAFIGSSGWEHTYQIADNIWLNLLFAGLFFALLYLYHKSRLRAFLRGHLLSSPERRRALRRTLLLVIGLLGLLFVFSTQQLPQADQYWTIEFATFWKKGNFNALVSPDGYLAMYSNQLGLVYFLYWLSFLFGDDNYLAFQLLNVVCLVWFYASLLRLSDDMSSDNQASGTLLLILGILFFPLILYTNFVYGTLIGLALSTAALVRLSAATRRFTWRSVIMACLLMLAAIVIKQNYLIFALGFLLVLLAHMLDTANWKLAFPCLGLAVVLLLSGSLVTALVTGLSGQRMPEDSGVSALAFVAMGVQENDDLYDGWWNHYNSDSYKDNGNSKSAQRAAALRVLKGRFWDFMQKPGYTLRFFAGKNASQWNNPTFQGLWINQDKKSVSEKLVVPKWVDRMLSLKGTIRLSAVLNRLQFIILLGLVFFALFHRPQGFVAASLCTVFLGGFVFHTFWEAKGQYTLPYFVMLFPLSVQGWLGAVHRLAGSAPRLRRMLAWPSKRMLKKASPLLLLLVLLAVIQSGIVPLFNDTIRRSEDTAVYRSYLAGSLEYMTAHLKPGDYRISPATEAPGGYLAALPSEEIGEDLLMAEAADEASRVRLSYYPSDVDVVSLRFVQAERNLDVHGATTDDGEKVWSYAPYDSVAQRWRILKTDVKGEYLIYYQANLVLTLNPEDGSLIVSGRADSPQQRWRIERVGS